MQQILNKIFKKVDKEKYGKYLELIPDFKKEKAQKFTTIVLTIIAVIILAIFAINPTLSTIANLQKQVEDAKFVTEKLQDKINSLSVLQTKYTNLQPDLPIIYESIPKDNQAPKITGQIQSITKDTGLTILNTQVTEITKSSNNFYYYTFSILATGTYENMLLFLDKLTTMQRITDISSINILRGDKSDSPLQINVKGHAFYKK